MRLERDGAKAVIDVQDLWPDLFLSVLPQPLRRPAKPLLRPLERLNAEVKRRTDVVGIFPNEAAITRLVGALLLEQSDEWSLQRRYMQLEGLQSLADNQTARLSAVVN